MKDGAKACSPVCAYGGLKCVTFGHGWLQECQNATSSCQKHILSHLPWLCGQYWRLCFHQSSENFFVYCTHGACLVFKGASCHGYILEFKWSMCSPKMLKMSVFLREAAISFSHRTMENFQKSQSQMNWERNTTLIFEHSIWFAWETAVSATKDHDLSYQTVPVHHASSDFAEQWHWGQDLFDTTSAVWHRN